MREYRRIRNAMSLFLAAYFIGGLLTLLHKDREIFPVYSWFLFALVPSGHAQYGLLLHEVNGQTIEPPRLYQEAENIILTAHSVTAFQLTQQFGEEFEFKRPVENHYREVLEKNWLPPKTRYELVKLKGDAIERWKSGTNKITRHLETFTSAEAAK